MTTETSGEETSPKAKLCEEAGFEFEVSRGSDFSFYNPSQKINRDLSTLAVCAFVDSLPNTIDNLKIVDCTSATGIRSIRYVKSLLNSVNKKFSSLSVKALDINEKAISITSRNIGIHSLQDIIEPICRDSIKYLGEGLHEFDVIDVDPYGTCAPFLESVLRSCRAKPNPTLLCLTSTDMRVLCRPNQTQCFRTYDVQFPQIFCQKELALRILLQFVNSKSIPHNLRIRPLLSLSTGHFVRLFIEVIKSPQKSLENLKYSSYGSFCDNCKSVKLIGNQMHNSQFKSKVRLDDLNCKICSKPQVQLGGRLWSGPLHCPDFLQQMLDSSKYVQLDNLKRCEAMLQVLKSELSIPFAFNTVEIARILKFGQPRLSSLLNNLTSNSFKWSFTLSDPECIKTTAPYNSFIKLFVSASDFADKVRTLEKMDDLLAPTTDPIDNNADDDVNDVDNNNKIEKSESNASPLSESKDEQMEQILDSLLEFTKQRNILNIALAEGEHKGPIMAVY